MPRPRSTYTAEFKLQAVKMVTDQKLSVAEAARRLDVGENLLREWRKAFLARGDAAFPGHGHLPPAEDEPGGAPAGRGSSRASGRSSRKSWPGVRWASSR